MAVLAIDFDGVLHDNTWRAPGHRMGVPIQGAREVMGTLKDLGHQLVIFTERGASPEHVEDWLDYFKIPYDSVTDRKPKADVYLDDRAVRFKNWAEAYHDIVAICAAKSAHSART